MESDPRREKKKQEAGEKRSRIIGMDKRGSLERMFIFSLGTVFYYSSPQLNIFGFTQYGSYSWLHRTKLAL
jgi:hypothetical protein